MAVSSQKFLPPGKSGSLAVRPAAKLAMVRTPLMTTSSESPAKRTFINIHKKVTSLTFIFRKSLVLKNNIINRKRKTAEVEKSKKREQKLEERNSRSKNKKNDGLLITPPGGSIIDSLTRFAGFTLLGYVVDKYSRLFPKLVEFGKILQPAVEIFGGFAKNLVGNAITFIERGYDAYDTVKGFAKKLGGENYERAFSQFSGALNTFLQAALLTGVAGFGGGLLKPKFLGLDTGSAAGGLGAGTLDQQLKRAKRYFSKYTFRTAKETAPIGSARLSNALLRTSLGIGRAKEFSTARALRANKAFALGYTPLKESYTSTRDKAIAKFIQEGATDKTNQALRRVGIGVIDDAPARNVRRNVLREMGFGNFVGPNEPLTPSRRNTIRKLPKSVKPVASTKILGQGFGSEIARLKKSYMKLGFSNSDLITIANDIEGKSFFERKAAYDLLDRRGLSSRVTNVPSLNIPRPVNRTPQGILNQQRFRAPSIPRPGEGIIPRTRPIQPSRGILGRGVGRIGKRAALRIGGRGAARFVGRIPVIGPLIDFIVSIALGDDPGEAAAGAVGAALGGFIGGALAGAGTFGLGAILGGAVGGFVGDLVVRSLYQAARDYVFKPKRYASGGQVSRGGKVQGEVSRSINIRDIKTDKRRVPIPVSPQQTAVGKHLQLDFEKLYGKKGLGLIINSSSEAKKMTFMQNVWGALGGAFIDMLLGQRPDTSLAPSIGSVFGALTTERFGERVSRGLADGLKNSSNNIFRNLMIASGETTTSSLDDTPSQEYAPPTNIPSAGYKPTSPGRFNVEQYVTGDRTHRNYAADHGGGNYHEHFGFKTKEDKERAKAALINAGFKIGSEFRAGDVGYHGANLAIDVPFYPNGPDLGYSDDKKGEEQFSRDIRRILGIDAPVVKPTPQSPVSQTPQASLAPNQTDIKTAYNGLNQQTSYEMAVHERNVFLYQQETILA